MIQLLLENNDIPYTIENGKYIIEESFFSKIKDTVSNLGGSTEFDPTRRKVALGAALTGVALASNKTTRNIGKGISYQYLNKDDGLNSGLIAATAANNIKGNKIVDKTKDIIKKDAKNITSELSTNIPKSIKKVLKYNGDDGSKLENDTRRGFLKKAPLTTVIGAMGAAKNIKQFDASKIASQASSFMHARQSEKGSNINEKIDHGRRQFMLNTPSKMLRMSRIVANPLATTIGKLSKAN